MAHCVNLHCGLRWCGWCSAAPNVHANVVFVMRCSDVASATTFLIFTCQVFFCFVMAIHCATFTCQVPLPSSGCPLSWNTCVFTQICLKFCLRKFESNLNEIWKKTQAKVQVLRSFNHILPVSGRAVLFLGLNWNLTCHNQRKKSLAFWTNKWFGGSNRSWVMMVWGNHIKYKSGHTVLAITGHFHFSIYHGPLCQLALWTEVMWLMQCSTKCSCQCRFCNALQWCCKCHYFLNMHLPRAFFRYVMTIHSATFTCQVQLLGVFILMCSSSSACACLRQVAPSWRKLAMKACTLNHCTSNNTSLIHLLACHDTDSLLEKHVELDRTSSAMFVQQHFVVSSEIGMAATSDNGKVTGMQRFQSTNTNTQKWFQQSYKVTLIHINSQISQILSLHLPTTYGLSHAYVCC